MSDGSVTTKRQEQILFVETCKLHGVSVTISILVKIIQLYEHFILEEARRG